MVTKSKLASLLKPWRLLPVFIFIINKNLLQRQKIVYIEKSMAILFALILSLLMLMVLIPMLLLLFIIKKIIETVIKYEDAMFHSMLNSFDTLWYADETTKSIITILLVVESNTNGQEVYETFKKLFPKAWKEHSKIHCTIEKKYGYFYWKKLEAYNEYDFITKYDKYESIEEWNKFMDALASAPMPLQEKGTFHMTVGMKSLKWRASSEAGTNQYPILVRFHHCIGDGASAVNFMTTQFCYDSVEIVTKYLNGFNSALVKKMSTQPKTTFIDDIKNIANANFKFIPVLDAFKSSLVPTKMLKEHRYLEYFSDQNQEVSNKIDVIRKNYNLTFTKLMLGLVQESIGQIYKRQIIESPSDKSDILTCLTAMLKSFKFEDNIAFSNDGHPVAILNNSFAMGLYENSIESTTAPNLTSINFLKTFLTNIKVLSEQIDLLNKSVDYQFISWMMEHMCASMPAFLMYQLLDVHKNVFVITSLPGLTEKLYIINSNPNVKLALVDLLYWLPQYKNTGLGVIISKYCGDLKLAFIANSAYIEKKEDAKLFTENILNNIDILYEAIEER